MGQEGQGQRSISSEDWSLLQTLTRTSLLPSGFSFAALSHGMFHLPHPALSLGVFHLPHPALSLGVFHLPHPALTWGVSPPSFRSHFVSISRTKSSTSAKSSSLTK